jgi:hypothetical protein
MLVETEVQEYLDEIRQQVCSRCVERPYGGPPCGPLGKPCGVELHLPQLIEATREVHSDLVEPYLDNNRKKICEGCAFLHSEFCPCPMDTLAVLVVEAIESVERRRRRREQGRERLADLAGADRPGLEEVARACEEALGTWTGCDWPTTFGRAGLDLNGWTAAEAETRAVEAAGGDDRETWTAAADWLREVERRAAQAEIRALQAVAAARKGLWPLAVENARRAWALEFQTGRTLRRQPPTWQPLYKVLRAIAQAQGEHPAASC